MKEEKSCNKEINKLLAPSLKVCECSSLVMKEAAVKDIFTQFLR